MTEDLYGLRGRPFGTDIDAEFYFEGRAQDRALSRLAYDLAQGDPFAVILGEAGIGKSMLAAHLVATIEPDRVVLAKIRPHALQRGGVAHALVQALGVGADQGDAARALESVLDEAARTGRRALAVIDDAQDIPESMYDELAALAGFKLGGRALLHTVLLGRPELKKRMARRSPSCPLRVGIDAAQVLGPLEPDDVRRYAEYRLTRVGWQGNPAFEPSLFADVFTASGGRPAQVNRICERLMLLAAVEQHAIVDRAMTLAVIAELAEEHASLAAVSDFEASAAPLAEKLAAQEMQIADLQNAMTELREGRADVTDDAQLAALAARIGALEASLRDQERAISQALARLIDWVEADIDRRDAA